jgi:hypothetical protein
MFLMGLAASAQLSQQSRFNWTNAEGGPIVMSGDPAESLLRAVPRESLLASTRPWADTAQHATKPPFTFRRLPGYLNAGSNLVVINVTSLDEAFDACAAAIECRALCYDSAGPNGTIATKTEVILKRLASGCGGSHCKAFPAISWVKEAPLHPPAAILNGGGFTFALVRRVATAQTRRGRRHLACNATSHTPCVPRLLAA